MDEDEAGGTGFLGGFLFGNIDESGLFDNEDFDKELQEGLTSFVKNAKSFGLESVTMLDRVPSTGETEQREALASRGEEKENEAEVPVAPLDGRLAGLIFEKKGGKQVRFTNLFRSGTLLPLTADDGSAASLRYRLRRYRVRRKKHPRAILMVDDQKELFHRKLAAAGSFGFSSAGSRSGADISGMASGHASRYRILGQLRSSLASVRKPVQQKNRLNELLSSKKQDSPRLAFVKDPEGLAKLSLDEHRFHPVETYEWEHDIVLDEPENQSFTESLASRKLTPKFVEVRQLHASTGPRPAYSLSSLASLLASRSASGSATPMRPPVSLPQLLKRPESEATRVINAGLAEGSWCDAIIWDEGEAPAVLPNTRLILDTNDPYIPIEIEEPSAGGSGSGVNLRDLNKLAKVISKMKARKAAGVALVTPPTVKAVNYAKVQSGDRFNLSNDKHYEASEAAGGTSVSRATRQSMVKSALAARIGLQHAVPAVKLLPPAFRTGLTKADLRTWHRPTLEAPLEPRWTFEPVVASKKLNATAAVGQVLRNAKKLTLKDGSEYALLEYSEENPLVLGNPGMATFLQQLYRKTSPKDTAMQQQEQHSWGTIKALEPSEQSPFWCFGDVPAGQSLPVIQNNLYRAVIFSHTAGQEDFLAVRTHVRGKAGSTLSLRALPPNVLLVGQLFPTAQIPGPHSRKQNLLSRARVQVFCYRLFAKDATAAQTGRPRLKLSRVLAAFPHHSDASIRKWMKEWAESLRGGAAGIWQRKADAPVLSEEDLRALVSPEDACVTEAMLVGQQRLQDAGVDLSEHLDDDAQSEIGGDNEQGSAVASTAPWLLTANLANAILGKAVLETQPDGDTFSLLRRKAPGEDARKAKGASQSDQAAFKQALSRIWTNQLESLSNPSPPAEEWPDLNRKREDDEVSLRSQMTSRTAGGQRRLVITRTCAGPEGSSIVESESLTDPLLIQAYLRERKALEVRFKKRQQMAVASAARAAQRPPPKRKSPDGQPPKEPKEPREPKPKKQISIRCSACGAVGHMRTNRICPFYEVNAAEAAAMAPVIEPGDVRVQGTKISIAKATLQRVTSSKPAKPAPAVITVGQQRALSHLSLFFQDICAALSAMPASWPFRRPVSRKDYPHYYRMIAKPLDLGTVRARSKRQVYKSPAPFLADVKLIADNCAQFNLEDHPFTGMARQIVAEAEALLEQKSEQIRQWMADLAGPTGASNDSGLLSQTSGPVQAEENDQVFDQVFDGDVQSEVQAEQNEEQDGVEYF